MLDVALYLVTQHLQLVEALSPPAAGAWMGPPALAMVLAAIGAPLLARRVRPGYLVLSILLLLLALTEVDHQAIAAGYTMSGTRSA